MVKVEEVLSYLEENLDAEHLAQVKNRLKKTLHFEQTDRLATQISINSEPKFEYAPYPETYENMEKMMVNELIPVCNQTLLKQDSLPTIRANYGVGTLPSLFGVKSKLVENNLPWAEPLAIDQVKALLYNGIPNLQNGLAGRALDTMAYYNETLEKFPNCEELIHVYHPDIQGPFDVAHLIWGSDIYIALYDEPEIVHQLLQLVTETYIAYLKKAKTLLKDEEDGFHYHWGSLFPGHVLLRDDSPVILSQEMYNEYVKPYDQQILNAFGGGSIHYCGRADQWIFSMMESDQLLGMNFGQPPNMEFGRTFLEKIYPSLKKHKIGIGAYYIDSKDLLNLANSEYAKGVTYMTWVDSLQEGQQLLEQLGN